ncbi:hypothetical protein EZV62_011910 [Acer yangbiense]|uniref:Uncharacterized protein n=1 Tax=Acer yangbiense TaxID=1000413 RepID=A0A5C7I981_9ROSI|nr:hypothetical protein EZV62_011910 [Acer yangbiense]
MVLHNFIRVNADIDQKFKPYDDDDDKLPSDDEEENATQDVYEERRPNHEMDKERDTEVLVLRWRWCIPCRVAVEMNKYRTKNYNLAKQLYLLAFHGNTLGANQWLWKGSRCIPSQRTIAQIP